MSRFAWSRWSAMRVYLLTLILAAVASPGGLRAFGADPGRELLVKYRVGVGGQGVGLHAPDGLPAGARRMGALALPGWERIELPEGWTIRRGTAWFRGRAEVLAVEPNQRYRAHRSPDDPEFGRLYGMTRVSAAAAWDRGVGSRDVVVAVFDTGMDLTHPDLAPNLWRNAAEIPGNGKDDDANGWIDDIHGVDVVDGDGDPADDAGHGTHVSGTIGAVGNNGRGVTGVAWEVRLMPVRMLSGDNSASTVEIVSAFDYVVRMRQKGANVRVINCSWGGSMPSLALREAMEAAGAAGILMVCSAGNDTQDTDALPVYPAGYDVPEIVVVGSSTSCDDPSGFSNYGRTTVDLAAPGSGILSTYRGGDRYAVLSGTSMASPHVAGAAALVFAARPKATPLDVRALLLGTVDAIPSWVGRNATGGRLNVARAVERAGGNAISVLTSPPALGGRMSVVSRAPNGRWGSGRSFQPAISADGRWVAFVSASTNFVARDTEGWLDIFLHDRRSNTVVRVSQHANGTGGNGDSESPAISADGRFVAFVSAASNLAAADVNAAKDVFVWDRNSRQLELVSVRSDGRAPGNNTSEVPSISANGQWVAFASDSTDLVAGDRNQVRDVFVRDRTRRSTERVSLGARSVEGDNWSDSPSISADGRIVAFHSASENLVSNDTNGKWDVFVRSRTDGVTELVGAPAAGDDDSLYPFVSGDGRWVAFSSAATTFGGGPTAKKLVVQLYDRVDKKLVRVAGLPDGLEPQMDAYVFGISHDGRFVSFSSDDPGLAPGGEEGFFRSFVFDRLRNTEEFLGISDAGHIPEDSAFYAPISSDGRFVAFVSGANGIVPGDGNGVADIFVQDRGISVGDLSVRLASEGNREGLGHVNPRIPQRAGQRVRAGRTEDFEVELGNGGVAQKFHLLARGSAQGWRPRVHVVGSDADVTTSLFSASGWETPEIPAGGRLLLTFGLTRQANEISEDVFAPRVEVREQASGEVLDAVSVVGISDEANAGYSLISRGSDGYLATRSIESGSASDDGERIVFATESDRLLPAGDLNLQADVYMVERLNGRVTRLSDPGAGIQGNAESGAPSISGDGRRVAFESRADNLVTGDNNEVEDIFVREIETGALSRASVSTTGVIGNRGSERPLLSSSGRVVAFTSLASNLVTNDTNGSRDVFIRDLSSLVTECVSRADSGEYGNGDSDVNAVSRTGRFVVFSSMASNLSRDDRNGYSDVYLRDREAGSTLLISGRAGAGAGNGPSSGASISDDGRWIVFSTWSTDLVAGMDGVERQSILLDRTTGQFRLVSDVVGALSEGMVVRGAQISPDGQSMAMSVSTGCGSEGTPAQVLVWDLVRQRMERVSVAGSGAWGSDPSFPEGFSPGSRRLLFVSSARNLVGEAAFPVDQLFLADLSRPGVDAIVRSPGGWRGTGVSGPGQGVNVAVPTPAAALGRGAEILLRVRNDGNVPDRFLIRANGLGGVRVQIGFAGAVSTTPVAPGTVNGNAPGALVALGPEWETPVIPPGESVDVRVALAFETGGEADVEIPIEIISRRAAARRDVVRLTATADVDDDGLPDAWEQRYFGGTGIAGIGTDAEGDGALDSEEWALSGDPTRPGDGIEVRLGVGAETRAVELRWKSKEGLAYRVEVSSQAGSPFSEVAQDSMSGTGGELVWKDPAGASAGSRVYRVRAELR